MDLIRILAVTTIQAIMGGVVRKGGSGDQILDAMAGAGFGLQTDEEMQFALIAVNLEGRVVAKAEQLYGDSRDDEKLQTFIDSVQDYLS